MRRLRELSNKETSLVSDLQVTTSWWEIQTTSSISKCRMFRRMRHLLNASARIRRSLMSQYKEKTAHGLGSMMAPVIKHPLQEHQEIGLNRRLSGVPDTSICLKVWDLFSKCTHCWCFRDLSSPSVLCIHGKPKSSEFGCKLTISSGTCALPCF